MFCFSDITNIKIHSNFLCSEEPRFSALFIIKVSLKPKLLIER